MSTTAYTRLKGLTHVGNFGVSNQIEHNIIGFLNWGTMMAGGFFNYESSGNNHYGQDETRMKPVHDPNYTDGKVWEGRRLDWVWESGVQYDPAPIPVSGVRVNGTFYPSDTTGIYSHYVDYPNGRVIFPSGLSTSAIVQVNHSPRYVSFKTGDQPWLSRVLQNTNKDNGFDIVASGNRIVMGDVRVQLPTVIVEAGPNRGTSPLQLGGGEWADEDVTFTILASNSFERNNIFDWLCNQYQKSIYMYDMNTVLASGLYPLDYRGSVVNNLGRYPDLVENPLCSVYKTLHVQRTQGFDRYRVNDSLFVGTVRWTTKVDMLPV